MSRQKRNLSCGFKLEPVTTYHMWFVVKVLQKYHRHRTTKKKECFVSKLTNLNHIK